jgi:glycosyltransferase involved in cell wall biosynthesis
MRRSDFGHKEPVSIVVPAYNEAGAIRGQIERIRKVMTTNQIDYEMLVIDDGSLDETGDLAVAGRARVIRHYKNYGYGAALKTGIDAARYQTIVIIDADGTYPAEEIPVLIQKLCGADMVVGARTGKHVHIPLIRRPAKWMLGWIAARIAGDKIPDLNSGLRVFRRDAAKQYFKILPNGFSFTTTITLAMLADSYRVVFHPIDYHKRIGKSKIVFRNFMDFVILVLRLAVLFKPLRIFLPLAFCFCLLGMVKTVFDLVLLFLRVGKLGWSTLFSFPIISTSSILFLLVSLQLVLIGMVTEALLNRISGPYSSLIPSHGVLTKEDEFGPEVGEREVGEVGRIER